MDNLSIIISTSKLVCNSFNWLFSAKNKGYIQDLYKA